MKKILTLLTLFVWILSLQAFSQQNTQDNPLNVADTLTSDFGLFTNSEVLNLTLRFDITQYQRKKPKKEYLDAVLTYHINERDSVNKNVRLRSRGAMRNGYCSFPPISLNFKNAGFQKADVAKIEKIKMVTHCEYGNEENLLKEYLVYKLYNVLTDNSFRVRLVKVTYINTSKPKSKPIETYSFLIEPVEMLAERTQAVVVEAENLSQTVIFPEVMNRMAIFNYMIGNTDWSVPSQHNCKVLSVIDINRPGMGTIVPYDFDYSGLVNADYAIPFHELPIKTVRERLYLGICRSEDEFNTALQEFKAHKDDFYKVINDFTLLDKRTKVDMIEYLDSFFVQFDSRNSIVSDLIKDCKRF
jgi:hypothetical protein